MGNPRMVYRDYVNFKNTVSKIPDTHMQVNFSSYSHKVNVQKKNKIYFN